MSKVQYHAPNTRTREQIRAEALIKMEREVDKDYGQEQFAARKDGLHEEFGYDSPKDFWRDYERLYNKGITPKTQRIAEFAYLHTLFGFEEPSHFKIAYQEYHQRKSTLEKVRAKTGAMKREEKPRVTIAALMNIVRDGRISMSLDKLAHAARISEREATTMLYEHAHSLSDQEIEKIAAKRDAAISYEDIGKQFGLHISQIGQVVSYELELLKQRQRLRLAQEQHA